MNDPIGDLLGGCGISLLEGKVLESVEETGDEITFVCTDGSAFRLYHMQDCCETVDIHDIQGNLHDLVGSRITEAREEVARDEWPPEVTKDHLPESYTWTTHVFSTESGVHVVVRWLGSSNGYYNENVHFGRTHKPIRLSGNN